MQEDREPEVWKPIPNYEGIYEVSSWGRVKSLDKVKYHYAAKNNLANIKGRILTYKLSNNYRYVDLYFNGSYKRYTIHVLVYSVFYGIVTLGKIINHKDSDRLNNYYKNLEEVFPRENSTHYHRVNKKNLVGAHYDGSGKRLKRWRSSIIYNKKKIGLGSYFTEKEAHEAYLDFLKEHGLINKYATENQEKS
jgi:hypothetical protein